MHKKLGADLTSLAHGILQMKNKEDIFALKSKAYEVYEKLAVLAYVEEYMKNTPNVEHTKDELITLFKNATKNKAKQKEVKKDSSQDNQIEISNEEVDLKNEEDKIVKNELQNSPDSSEVDIISKEIELIHENNPTDSDEELINDDLFSQPDKKYKIEEMNANENKPSLEEELKDTIAADVVADLFENAPKKSLNDNLQMDIQIGLNDRIVFVKNLFGGSQEDFNRVVSQLNSFKTEKEAKKFINKMVRPDYDWTDMKDIEERFIAILERKFL
tara:strand:+ start:39254 stop:40072 length:819 start_codon:yes stop_codon:yes gene_type:complete